MQNIKAIIWDWARTLYDVDNTNREFPEAQEILDYCQKKNYRQTLISLVIKTESNPGVTLESRHLMIDNSPLQNSFEKILITDAGKDASFDEMVKYLGLSREQILIIDDRTIRGIQYANKNGHPSVWLRQGKYANELPNEETGQPTYTVKSLKEIKNII